MADFAVGTWNMDTTENFDEYMKAVGVGFVTRKMAAQIKPCQKITVDGDTWTIKTISTLKNTEISFKLGQEFVEETADGRKVKTTINLDGQKLTATQKGDVDSSISREWNGDTMTMELIANGVMCKRVYKRG